MMEAETLLNVGHYFIDKVSYNECLETVNSVFFVWCDE